MSSSPAEPPGSLRALIAEALHAYELAQAARLQAEGEAAADYLAQVDQAEAARQEQAGRLERQGRQALLIASAEKERGAVLLSAVDAVDAAARALLERAGLAHISGAPLSLEHDAAPVRRPDEVVAAAFSAAQLALTDLRIAMLRLARTLAAAGQWEPAQRILRPLVDDGHGALFDEVQSLHRELRYELAVRALTTGDWAAARRDLQVVVRIDPRYRDASALLRGSFLQAAQQSGQSGAWQAAQEDLTAWLREDPDDHEAREALCTALDHLIEQAMGANRLDDASAYLRRLQTLDAQHPRMVGLPARYPSLWWAGAVETVDETRWDDDTAICAALSPNRLLLASGGTDKRVRVRDIGSGRVRHNLWEHFKDVTAVAFSPDGSLLASGSEDRTVAVWALPAAALERKLKGHRHNILAVAISPDRQWLASAGEDGTARLWELGSGKLRHTFEDHMGSVTCVAFAPRGQWLAGGGEDHNIKVWELDGGSVHLSLEGHAAALSSLAYSQDGSVLASGSADGTVRIWDAESGRLRQILSGHEGSVTALAFAPDGRLLASAGIDSTMRLWDPAAGRARATLDGQASATTSLVFAPDGQTLAAASADLAVRIWAPKW